MSAHPVDIHVGKRIRMHRKMLGLSQDDLGKSVGVTFQQVQKYERGTNRVGSSRLYELSQILNVPVEYFFEDFSPSESLANSNNTGFADSAGGNFDSRSLDNKETINLVQSYYRIKDPAIRTKLLALIKTLRTED